MISSAEIQALRAAHELSRTPGVPPGPNPRVGCVLLSPTGVTVGSGFHRGAGTAHAEIDALTQAGDQATGATAVVTLEPCNHVGRTSPCAQALISAGVARVVYAVADPGVDSAGGADTLRAAGIDVVYLGDASSDDAIGAEPAYRAVIEQLRPWIFSTQHERPFVTLKTASSLDGRVAAADGSSRWITGVQARAEVHELRTQVDAIMIGTSTAITDDPSLTARSANGNLLDYQPLRVIVGKRDLQPGSQLMRQDSAGGEVKHLRTHDIAQVLDTLHRQQVHHVLVEGGPTLSTAFIQAGLVNQWISYVAPLIVGSGPSVVGDLGTVTMSQATRWRVVGVASVGADVKIMAEPVHLHEATSDRRGA